MSGSMQRHVACVAPAEGAALRLGGRGGPLYHACAAGLAGLVQVGALLL